MSSRWLWPTLKPAGSKNLAVQRYNDGEQPNAPRNEANNGGAMQITGNEMSLTVNETRGSDINVHRNDPLTEDRLNVLQTLIIEPGIRS